MKKRMLIGVALAAALLGLTAAGGQAVGTAEPDRPALMRMECGGCP